MAKTFAAIQVIVLSLLLLLLFGNAADLNSDRTALLAIRSSVGGRSLLWNVSRQTPCSWAGVECQRERVTGLRLPAMGLSGELPGDGAFGNLTRLHTLSLRFNALTGSLPSDIASCTDLRNLYLQGNLFSGHIPASLFALPNLIRLNLAANNFTGEIPPAFSKLTRLRTLFLENNRLTGRIPDLKLPGLVQFNVSSNRLTGSVPQSLSRMTGSAFAGNSLCGGPLLACPDKGTRSGTGAKFSGAAIAGIVIGSVVALFIILVILILLFKRKSGEKTSSIDRAPAKHHVVEIPGDKSVDPHGDAPSSIGHGGPAVSTAADTRNGNGNGKGEVKGLIFFGNGDRSFDLEGLLRASAEVLGKGTFGTVYKATLEMGFVVAVKRLKDVVIPEGEFREKIQALGRMDHENLVPLRAYYYNNDEKLLVYDYMPMGSFSALLHGNRGVSRSPLDWETRSTIALGAARGIAYLHSQSPSTSHGNIKSSNILLTNSYEGCVSDFGLASIAGNASTSNRVSGYCAPEVTNAHKVSQKADVYSFGVLLLELLTGKPPTHSLLNEEGVDLPRWVQSVVRDERTSELFDIELLRFQKEGMVELLQLAVDCTVQYPDNRPAMAEVAQRVEDICNARLQKMEDAQQDFVGEEPGRHS